MEPMEVTLEVFQPVSGWLKLVAASKTDCGTESGTDDGGERESVSCYSWWWVKGVARTLIISTFEVSQLPMSPLKLLAPANMYCTA